MAQNILAALFVFDDSAASGCLLKILGDTAISRLIRQLAKFGVKRFTVISNICLPRFKEEISLVLGHNSNLKMLGAGEMRSILWDKVILIPVNLLSDSETVKKLISIPESFVLLLPADAPERSEKPNFMDSIRRFVFASLQGRSSLALEVLERTSEVSVILESIVDAGLKRIQPQELSSYSATMKTRLEPFIRLLTPDTPIHEIEKYLVKRVQKGKHLTSYINKPIEDFLSLRAARLGTTPNQITVLSNILAYSATLSMLSNQALLSVLLMFITCIVDGLDGKIARLRSMESDFGSLEHSFDFLYEQAWYGSYVWYLFTFLNENLWLALGICALVIDAFVRHVYNQFKITTGIALTDTSTTARLFAKVDGRRNIYVIYVLFGLLFNMPALALTLITSHATLTALLYLVLARCYLGNRHT